MNDDPTEKVLAYRWLVPGIMALALICFICTFMMKETFPGARQNNTSQAP